ncbi:MAG: 5-methyltetrahydropteroyltriglutamate--homocysteine S-methyltransferase [Chloroflexota bacterium]
MKRFFRADHVGSLLRPTPLKEGRIAYDAGNLPYEALLTLENKAIDHVIAQQEALGLQAVTDGEFRRANYFVRFNERVNGYTMMESNISFDEDDKQIKYLSPAVTGKLQWVESVAMDELAYTRTRTDKTVKITLPSPADQHMFRFREGISDDVYPDLEQFFADVTAVYQQELHALAQAGARYVQLDDTTFTLFCDEKWLQRVVARGYDPQTLLNQYIRLINSIAQSTPPDMTLAMHMCRGNNQGEWLFSGGYDAVAEALFSQVQVDSLFLEYDSDRAGSFEPLRFIPHDKFVVLGLITSKAPQLEREGELVRRIEAAAAYFPLAKMGLSPQCGFASTLPGNPLDEAAQWRKLELIVQTANRVWGSIDVSF